MTQRIALITDHPAFAHAARAVVRGQPGAWHAGPHPLTDRQVHLLAPVVLLDLVPGGARYELPWPAPHGADDRHGLQDRAPHGAGEHVTLPGAGSLVNASELALTLTPLHLPLPAPGWNPERPPLPPVPLTADLLRGSPEAQLARRVMAGQGTPGVTLSSGYSHADLHRLDLVIHAHLTSHARHDWRTQVIAGWIRAALRVHGRVPGGGLRESLCGQGNADRP